MENIQSQIINCITLHSLNIFEKTKQLKHKINKSVKLMKMYVDQQNNYSKKNRSALN